MSRELEPNAPFTQNLNGEYQYIYIDSKTNKRQTDKANIIISTDTDNGNFPSILVKDVIRMAIVGVQVDDIFNCNERNNTIRFQVNGLPTFYTVQVRPGMYRNPATLMGDIVIALNSISGTTGATFVGALDATYNSLSRYELSCNVTFRIDPTCTAITKGSNLWNLPASQNYALAKKVGPMYMQYSRWLDIVSDDLMAYQAGSTNSNSNFGNGNNLIRYYFGDVSQDAPDDREGPKLVPLIAERWWAFNSNRTISSISFRLIDEYGDPIYQNPLVEGVNTWNWQLIILAQVI